MFFSPLLHVEITRILYKVHFNCLNILPCYYFSFYLDNFFSHHLFIRLPICLTDNSYIFLSIYLAPTYYYIPPAMTIYLYIYIYIYIYMYQSIYLSVCLSIFLSCLSIYLSCLCIALYIYLSISLYL